MGQHTDQSHINGFGVVAVSDLPDVYPSEIEGSQLEQWRFMYVAKPFTLSVVHTKLDTSCLFYDIDKRGEMVSLATIYLGGPPPQIIIFILSIITICNTRIVWKNRQIEI